MTSYLIDFDLYRMSKLYTGENVYTIFSVLYPFLYAKQYMMPRSLVAQRTKEVDIWSDNKSFPGKHVHAAAVIQVY